MAKEKKERKVLTPEERKALREKRVAEMEIPPGFVRLNKSNMAAIRRCDRFEITKDGLRCHKQPSTRDTNDPFAVARVASVDVKLPKGTVNGIPQGTSFSADNEFVGTFIRSIRKDDAVHFGATKVGKSNALVGELQRLAGRFTFLLVAGPKG